MRQLWVPNFNHAEHARETLNVLLALLRELRELDPTRNAKRSDKHTLDNPRRLDPAYCPLFPEPATIRVINADTLNAGIKLAKASANAMQTGDKEHNLYPVIINFTEREKPGGGWLNGALAQEETLCYRSSLYLSLDKRHYPLSSKEAEAIYSPYVVLSVAAVRKPELRRHKKDKLVFRRDRDRNLTKDNMRLVLRMAAYHRHRDLVLSALGCGVYANPPEDVAHCWLEVLREDEFAGHWWRNVYFAVYDRDARNEGNYQTFKRVLQDQKV
ncbi:hypothetical protein QBC46DRAFT_460512 [Diplogelasinospora grovesii]|uniref:Microbial-type PARG catalytic domain-containing protein n=1 Tax=Diplogelasinospora grovesii TaxID=303347 RepID=A0AAN6S2C3_9PEZI|nr:hypothetical protein QBC46DRAFT_460512 [Diplogelasinospora grovesii]